MKSNKEIWHFFKMYALDLKKLYKEQNHWKILIRKSRVQGNGLSQCLLLLAVHVTVLQKYLYLNIYLRHVLNIKYPDYFTDMCEASASIVVR